MLAVTERGRDAGNNPAVPPTSTSTWLCVRRWAPKAFPADFIDRRGGGPGPPTRNRPPRNRVFEDAEAAAAWAGTACGLCAPVRSNTSISPGRRRGTYLRRSCRARGFDARIGWRSRSPSTKGRMPRGSRAPISSCGQRHQRIGPRWCARLDEAVDEVAALATARTVRIPLRCRW